MNYDNKYITDLYYKGYTVKSLIDLIGNNIGDKRKAKLKVEKAIYDDIMVLSKEGGNCNKTMILLNPVTL